MNKKTNKEKPFISIIIPAWRDIKVEGFNIKTLLDSIPGSSVLPHEVIVVCNSQSPSVAEAIRQHPAVTRYCLNSQNVGVSRAWNLGAHLAEGSLLCFINEDVVLGAGTIDTLAEKLSDMSEVAVIGVEGANFDIQANGAITQRQRIKVGSPQFCDAVSGFLFMVKAEVFQSLGGFDDALSPCFYEEMDFALRVRAGGFKSFIVPGLAFDHPWGVSASTPRTAINYLGRWETLKDIHRRNRDLFLAKWQEQLPIISTMAEAKFGSDYYGEAYFAPNDYIRRMTQPCQIKNRWEQPLAKTLADMVDAVALSLGQRPCRTLELGCAHGFAVQELLSRGYDAFGMDFSRHCVENSPVKSRLTLQDVRSLPVNQGYDLVLATNLFEHVSDTEALEIISRTAKIARVFFTTINKSPHDPSHINLKSNLKWIKLFQDAGFRFNPRLTALARKKYREKSAGSERWQRDCLVFSRANSDNSRQSLLWRMGLAKEAMLDATEATWARLSVTKNLIKRFLRDHLKR